MIGKKVMPEAGRRVGKRCISEEGGWREEGGLLVYSWKIRYGSVGEEGGTKSEKKK